VLAVAAVLKAFDPHAFAEEIARLGVTFGLPEMTVGMAALALEAAIGFSLLTNLRRRGVLLAATALVLFFLFLTGRTAWRAAHGLADAGSSCGCFGNLVERSPTEAFVQDLLLMAPALALAWLGRPGARSRIGLRAAVVTILTVGVVLFAHLAPGLPIDDWATRLRPGVALADLCAGSGQSRVCLATAAPVLARGEHLVVIADAGGDDFVALAGRLNQAVRSGAAASLVVLADVAPEEQQALFWQVAPAFDLQPTPTALLRPLYRRLPRSFEVRDGRVVATWPGLPPQIPAAGDAGGAGTNHPENR